MAAGRFISPLGDARLPAGQALTIERAFQTVDGTAVDLTGRSFTLSVFRQDTGEALVNAGGSVGGGVASFSLSSADTVALYAQQQAKQALGWRIVEHLAGGNTSFVFGPRGFALDPAGELLEGAAGTPVVGAPVVRFIGGDGPAVIRIESIGSALSTYQLWLADGNEGSFQDFLDEQNAAAAAEAMAATLADREATGQDRTATAADRVQTTADRSAAGQSKTDAQTAAATAALERAGAEAARATAVQAQALYDTTAAGLAAITSGLIQQDQLTAALAALARNAAFQIMVDGYSAPDTIVLDAALHFVRSGASGEAAVSLVAGDVATLATTVAALPPPVQYLGLMVDGLESSQVIELDAGLRLVSRDLRAPLDVSTVVAATAPVVLALIPTPFGLMVDGATDPVSYTLDPLANVVTLFTGGGGGSGATSLDRSYTKDATTKARILTGLLNDLSTGQAVMKLWLHGGQSLAVGVGEGSGSAMALVLSTIAVGRNYCPSVGPWTWYDRGWTTLAPAVETTHDGGTYGETGAVAFANRWATRVHDTFGAWPLTGTLVFGRGATSIEDLDRGSLHYQYLLEDLRKICAWCVANGVAAIDADMRWTQGNNNAGYMTQDVYAARLNQLRAWVQEDLTSIASKFGIELLDHVTMYVVQGDSARPTGATAAPIPFPTTLAHLLAAQRYPETVRFLGCNQDIPRFDGVHPYNPGYYQMGQRDAERVYQDQLVNPLVPFAPLSVARFSDVSWDLEFDPPFGDLVLDTSGDAIATAGLDWGRPANGYGFEFGDPSQAYSLWPYVSSLTILPSLRNPSIIPTRNTRLRVTLSAAPTGYSPTLWYALRDQGADSSPITGARGCLRDSAGWPSDRDMAGNPVSGGATAFVARNWAARFTVPLPR